MSLLPIIVLFFLALPIFSPLLLTGCGGGGATENTEDGTGGDDDGDGGGSSVAELPPGTSVQIGGTGAVLSTALHTAFVGFSTSVVHGQMTGSSHTATESGMAGGADAVSAGR